MLDHHQRVAQVAQGAQRGKQPVVVPLVQADRRLVQYVQHPGQRGADLRGQADALRLAARQRARAAAQCQVVQTHVHQEAQPRVDLPENLLGDEPLLFAQLDRLKEARAVPDGQIADLGDRFAAHRDRQRLALEPAPAAHRAGHLLHQRADAVLHHVGAGLFVSPFQVGHDPLERCVEGGPAPAALIGDADLLLARAVEDFVEDFLRQAAHRRVQRKAVVRGERLEVGARHAAPVEGAVPAADLYRALIERERPVGQHAVRVDLLQHAQTHAGRARAVGIVEGEHARGELAHRHAAVRTGVVLTVQRVPAADFVDDHQPVRQLQRGFQRVGQPLVDFAAHDQPVDHRLERVLLLLVQLGRVAHVVDFAVHAHAHEALPPQILDQLDVFALAAAHDGREHLDLCALGQQHDLVDDLVDRLLADFPAAVWAVRHARARVEQAQVVVNFGHGAHGRAGVAAGGLLVDRDGGGKAVD